MKKLIFVCVCLAMSGCTYGDKYDGLIVADGEGNVYTLKHRFIDVYFVRKLEADEKDNNPHSEANKKLLESVLGGEK